MMLEKKIVISKTSLIKKTLATMLLAVLILVAIVLPAEYGIDSTGFGKMTGLTLLAAETGKTGETKSNDDQTVALDNNAPGPFPQGKANFHNAPPSTKSFNILLKPLDEVEYKAVLKVGEPIFYHWSVQSGDRLYVDFHGDPTEGEFPDEYFQRYQEGDLSHSRGSFTPTFTGHHGWYWLNTSDHEVSIQLEVTGYFQTLEEIYRGNQLEKYQ